MTDPNRIHPRYRAMLGMPEGHVANPATAHSPTEAENAELDPGARWSQEATFRAYTSGGNEGDWDPDYHPDDPDVGPAPR